MCSSLVLSQRLTIPGEDVEDGGFVEGGREEEGREEEGREEGGHQEDDDEEGHG